MIFRLLRKIFDPRYTDKKVDKLNDASKKVFDDTAKVAKRHADLMKKNGVMMQIYIVTGGDHRGR